MKTFLSDVYEPNGIAIDWINKNIYYTDAQYGAIFMTNKNGKYRKRILSGLAAPRYLAIDPLQGALFWTDAVDGTVNMASSNGPTQVHSNPDLQKPYLVLNDKHRKGSKDQNASVQGKNNFRHRLDRAVLAVRRSLITGAFGQINFALTRTRSPLVVTKEKSIGLMVTRRLLKQWII